MVAEELLTPALGENPTIREVYQLVNQCKVELMAEIEKVSTAMTAEINKVETTLESKLVLHNQEHKNEEKNRSSMWRWAVTTVMSGLGVLAAIIVAILF